MTRAERDTVLRVVPLLFRRSAEFEAETAAVSLTAPAGRGQEYQGPEHVGEVPKAGTASQTTA
jgi:hypothetical protein